MRNEISPPDLAFLAFEAGRLHHDVKGHDSDLHLFEKLKLFQATQHWDMTGIGSDR